MCGVVVQDDVNSILEQELAPQLLQEFDDVVLVGRVALYEDRSDQFSAYTTKNRDANSTCLVERPLDRFVMWGPVSAATHPHVEGRLVKVNNRLVVNHHPRQRQGEVENRSFRFFQRLLICEADTPVLDVVLEVEVS
jgi:hypothetical protein